MAARPLPPEIALRIGVAARLLPTEGLPRLMAVLVATLGLPLTAAKLESLTLSRLRQDESLGPLPRALLRQVLGYLRGSLTVTIIDVLPPALEAYEEGDMPASVRVAVASNGGESLDAGFRDCAAYLVYQVSAEEIRLIDRRLPGGGGEAGLKARVVLVDDCHLLYARRLGNAAAAQLMRAGVHPLQAPAGGAARAVLARLQPVLADNPPPWLARAMGEDLVMPLRVGFSEPVLVHPRDSGR